MDEEAPGLDPRKVTARATAKKAKSKTVTGGSRRRDRDKSTPGPDSGGGAAGKASIENSRFWGAFLDDPVAAKAMPKYNKFLWAGVPDEFGLRRQVWPTLCDKISQAPKLSPKLERNRLNPAVLEHLKIELEHEDCFGVVGDGADQVDKELVEKLVVALHLSTNQLSSFICGSVQLAALMLDVCDHHLHEAYKVLTALVQIMDEYLANSQVQLRTDCLVVADLVAKNIKYLADTFNGMKNSRSESMPFDVVDFSDLVCLWAKPIFVYSFPKEFVLRVIDLLFAEGVQIMAYVLYGIIYAFRDELTSITNFEELYSFLYSIPEKQMTSTTIDKIFKAGVDLFVSFPATAKLRAEKDWVVTMEKIGVPLWKEGVGYVKAEDPVNEKEDSYDEKTERPSGAVSILGMTGATAAKKTGYSENSDSSMDLKEEISPIAETTITISKEELKSSGDGVYEKIQKLLNANSLLKQQLEDRQRELRDRTSRIHRLEAELEKMETKIRTGNTLTGTAQKLPVIGRTINTFISDKEALERMGPSAVDVPDSKVVDDDYKYQSFQLNDFKIMFSAIYEHMELPCVYMEGYLFKLSKGGMFGRTQMNRRWFVLKGRFLTYFKSHLHSKPQKDKALDLKGWKLSPIAEHPKGEHAFEVSHEKVNYLLFASDEKELYKWLIALRAAVQ